MPPVGPALERLGRLLESDDFQDQIRAYQLRVDAEVEKRMSELEVRLKELETRLQDGDRALRRRGAEVRRGRCGAVGQSTQRSTQ